MTSFSANKRLDQQPLCRHPSVSFHFESHQLTCRLSLSDRFLIGSFRIMTSFSTNKRLGRQPLGRHASLSFHFERHQLISCLLVFAAIFTTRFTTRR